MASDDFLAADAATRDATHRADVKAECELEYERAMQTGVGEEAAKALMQAHETKRLHPIFYEAPDRGGGQRVDTECEENADDGDVPPVLPIAELAADGATANGTGSTGVGFGQQALEWTRLLKRDNEALTEARAAYVEAGGTQGGGAFNHADAKWYPYVSPGLNLRDMNMLDLITKAIVDELVMLHPDQEERIRESANTIGDCPDNKGLNGHWLHSDIKDIVARSTASVTVSPAVGGTALYQWSMALLHAKLNIGQRVLMPLLKQAGTNFSTVINGAAGGQDHALRDIFNIDAKVLRRLHLMDSPEDKKDEQDRARNTLHTSPTGSELDHLRMILADAVVNHLPTACVIPRPSELEDGLDGYCWVEGDGSLACGVLKHTMP